MRISLRSEQSGRRVEKQSGILRLERPPVLLHRFVALRLAQRGERVRVGVLQVLPSFVVRCVHERVLLPGEHLLHAVVRAEDGGLADPGLQVAVRVRARRVAVIGRHLCPSPSYDQRGLSVTTLESPRRGKYVLH